MFKKLLKDLTGKVSETVQEKLGRHTTEELLNKAKGGVIFIEDEAQKLIEQGRGIIANEVATGDLTNRAKEFADKLKEKFDAPAEPKAAEEAEIAEPAADAAKKKTAKKSTPKKNNKPE